MEVYRKDSKMLVLQRTLEESIMIGDDIEIKIVDVRGDRVRLGITAPANVSIHRKEIWEAIQRQKKERENESRDAI